MNYKYIFVHKELGILKIGRKLKELFNKIYHELVIYDGMKSQMPGEVYLFHRETVTQQNSDGR